MRDIMVDIETLGTTAGSPILSIAAIAFDAETQAWGEEFQANIDPATALAPGMAIDIKTVAWWMEQSEEARSAAFTGTMPLRDALDGFAQLIKQHQPERVWAKPPSFDLVILEAAYRAFGQEAPWHYRTPRDMRTLTDFAIFTRKTTPSHIAIEDVRDQIGVVMECYARRADLMDAAGVKLT
ncbi:exodeoxyribonuclease VIII [Devosia crocina]|uniref:Exodeoxyribonuclease VIII n=1 Tax=Devosia crocina TaxID=429728 RepID=A0A1I7N9W3_9HYPH|nr:3'-5' exonuclease [Devosia crocina]SFV31438.1 exodeoxyribonuclease VIII [Devosia crocina]